CSSFYPGFRRYRGCTLGYCTTAPPVGGALNSAARAAYLKRYRRCGDNFDGCFAANFDLPVCGGGTLSKHGTFLSRRSLEGEDGSPD
ncbi:MAG: hypothetical protein J6J97_08630, partial [Akkermansia sp.]|nr:hypothetical protein [Akkermansia sp.]